LSAVIHKLAAASTADEVMRVVTWGVRGLLHADGATFVLRDGDRCYYAEEDAISPLWKGRRFPMSTCVTGWSMLHRQPVVVPDIYQDPRIPIDLYRPAFVRSLAIVPVGSDPPLAALGAYWAERREPPPQELGDLQAIADAAALALRNVKPAPEAPDRSSALLAVPGGSRRKAGAARPIPLLGGFSMRVRNRGVLPNSPEAYAFAVLCVLAAVVAREIFEATGVKGPDIFSTCYPAVAVAMLVGGRRAGILAAALGGFVGYWLFMPPKYKFAPLNASDALNLLLYGLSCILIILIVDWYKRTVLRLRQEDARHLTLAREQAHRVKNAISVVEAIVRQSFRDETRKARLVNKRIRAALVDVDIGDSKDVAPRSLRALLAEDLQPFDLARFRLAGADDAPLAPELCSLLSLTIHELSTNALKYGALSTPNGCVDIDWGVADGRLTFAWSERGGPPVSPPQSRGYGGVLLRRLIEGAKGSLRLDFQPAGLAAEISLPLAPPAAG
jgi:two-component sensor histidine kinase